MEGKQYEIFHILKHENFISGKISEMFQLQVGRAKQYPTDFQELLKSGRK